MSETTKTAYVFPGQGSQLVGMGHDLYDSFDSAKDIYKQADEVLGFSLSKLCFEGPEEELRQTLNAQPALLTTSFAFLQALRETGGHNSLPPPDFMAGHSLGEYTALAAAGVFDFATAVRLAWERGRLMHEAGLTRPGGMAAVIGMDETQLAEICRQSGVWIANINCPGQLAISGEVEKLAKAMALVKENGATRVIPLQVSCAFHTPLIQPVVADMSRFITSLPFNEPSLPIIANTTAESLTTTAAIKKELLMQLCNSVQWQRSVEYMGNNGVSTFIEIGPGKVLTGLIRRINREVKTINISDLEAVRSLANPQT